MSYKEINAMRKEGNLSQALAMAESEFAIQPDMRSAVALFWSLNSLRKETDNIDQSAKIVERMASLWEKFAPDNAVLQKTVEVARQSLSPEAMSERRAWKLFKAAKEAPTLNEQKKLLYEYLKVDNPRPSLLHSLVLIEAIKISREHPDDFDLVAFVDLWGLNNLRAEDWDKPDNKDGMPLPSTIERLIPALVKNMLESHSAPHPAICMLVDQAMEAYPKNRNLVRNKAQLLALGGDKDYAISVYTGLISKQPDVFYLWDELSELVDDANVRTGMLCYAVCCQTNECFLPKTRTKLAYELANLGYLDYAKRELDMAAATYERNNWTRPSAITQLASTLAGCDAAIDCIPIYEHFKGFADNFIFSGAQTEVLIKLKEVKSNQNGRASISWQMRGQNGMVWINPSKMNLDLRVPKGSAFLARMRNGEPIAVQPTQLTSDLPWLRRVDGVLIIKNAANGKRFGFVDSVFVTGSMLAGHNNGDNVSVLAVLNPDNRWGAIVIY